MAPPKKPSSDDPQNNPETPAKTPKGYEKVVDELRNVLSSLDHSQSEASPQELPAPEDELLRSPQPINSSNDLESEQLGEAAFLQALEPTSTDNPSDADFWKGNVLGWPDPPPENAKEPTPVVPPLPSQGFSPFQEDFSIPPSPPAPSSGLEDSNLEMNRFINFADPDPAQNAMDVPAPPVSPVDKVEESEEPVTEDQRSSFLGNLRIPIPRTLHEAAAPPVRKKNDETLAEMNIQPTNHIQVACFFPDGQDELANDFMAKIKMSAAKSIGYPEIEIVLSTPWFLAQIDLHSWKKAASLSGAHFMLVLAHKKDKDLFKDLTKVGHQDEVRARLVFLEQVKLKTLYADLLADVMRHFNGKG